MGLNYNINHPDNSEEGSLAHSMSKWTRLVRRLSILLMLMMVIGQIPNSIEGKSLYSEQASQGTEHLQQQQQAPLLFVGGSEKAGVGDMDYGSRDEYDGSSGPASENAFLNYLYTRQLLTRLRPPQQQQFLEPSSSLNWNLRQPQQQQLQLADAGINRKRTSTYWKQCAFNAVSCFG